MPELQTKGCRVRFALHPVAMLVGLLLQGTLAHAQDGQTTEPPLVLRPSPQLQETFPDDVRKGMPTFMSGDRTEGQTDRSPVWPSGRSPDLEVGPPCLLYTTPSPPNRG